jgi:dUTP pyrophosphatase
MTSGSAGMDLYACETVGIPAGEWKKVPCGISIAIPPGFEGQIRPRSGLAFAHGVTVLNAPGTIDSDYRGLVQVILVNLGREEFAVERGSRIAQLIIAPVVHARWLPMTELEESERSQGGFGHTGR